MESSIPRLQHTETGIWTSPKIIDRMPGSVRVPILKDHLKLPSNLTFQSKNFQKTYLRIFMNFTAIF